MAGLFRGEAAEVPRVSPDELQAWLSGAQPPVVLDVRTRGQYAAADGQISGSVRVPPDQVQEWAAKAAETDAAARDRRVVAYCT